MANAPTPPPDPNNPAVKTLLEMNKDVDNPPEPPAPTPEPPAPTPTPEPPPAPEPEPPPAPEPGEPSLPPPSLSPEPPAPTPPLEPVNPETHDPATGQPYKTKDENIKSLVTVKRDMETKLQEATARIAELESNPPAPEGTVTQAQYDELNQQLTTALDQVAELDLARDPRFRSQFDDKQRTAVEHAKLVAMGYGASEDLASRATKLTGVDRAELLKQESPEGWVQISQALVEYDRLEIEKSQKLQNAAALRAELDAQSQTEANQQATVTAEFATRTLDAALTKYASDGMEVFIEVPGAEYKEWNSQVAAVKQTAQNMIKEATPETHVHTALLAAATPVYRSMYLLVQKQLAAAQAELNEIKEAQPNLRGRVPSPGTTPPHVVAPKDVADPAKELSDRVFKKREFREAPLSPR